MAKAIATCTCKGCGKKFEKVKRNIAKRSDADKWEEWAKSFFDQCPECWKKERREQDALKPLTLTLQIELGTEQYVLMHFSGNTMPEKDNIKMLDFWWTDVSGGYGKAWQKRIQLEDLNEELVLIKELFPEVVVESKITQRDVFVYKQTREKMKQKKKEMEEKIAELKKPEKPECYPNGKWNGRFYGSDKNGYSVYIDGTKT